MFGWGDLVFYIFIFFFGGFIGSFLGVIIDRYPKGESFVFGRSHCDHCRKELKWHDLIPYLSFIFLNGKCRYCKKSLSYFYFVIEIVTGIVFQLVTFFVFGKYVVLHVTDPAYVGLLLYYLFLMSSFITVFFMDLKHGIIPFKIVIATLAAVTIKYLFMDPGFILNYFISGVGVFGAFLLLFLITKGRGIGFGDVVFSLLMGYLLGWPQILLGVYIAFLTGAVVSLILVIVRRKRFKGGVIPFGPFLVSGTVVSLFWGQVIIERIVSYL